MLFFQCMAGLLSSDHRRREGIKWRFILYTMAMFSFVTVYTAMNLQIQSNTFIDHRELPGTPLNYQYHARYEALGFIPNVMFNLNNWLADGLLVSSFFGVAPTHPGV